MSKIKVKVHARVGLGECDDCGSYETGEAELSLPDGASVSVDCDGHFGGEWNGEEVELRRIALGLAGFAPLILGELPEDAPAVMTGIRDESGSLTMAPAHEALGRPWVPVEVSLEHLGDDPRYPTPVKASWVDAEGAPREHVFEAGDWKPFWVDFCDSMVEIDMDFERRWDDDYDSD